MNRTRLKFRLEGAPRRDTIGSTGAGIILRLTRTKRFRAVCALTLLYLACVMAPTIALAMPGASTPDCLTLDDQGAAPRVQAGEPYHHAGHDLHDVAAVDTGLIPANAPTHTHHHRAGAACCELMCLTALPAGIIEVPAHAPVASRATDEAGRAFAAHAPPLLYRPPILFV